MSEKPQIPWQEWTKDAIQFIRDFRQLCDSYAVPHDNVYNCMDGLQASVKKCHGKPTMDQREAYLSILDTVLFAPRMYFDRDYDPDTCDIDDYDDEFDIEEDEDEGAVGAVFTYEQQKKERLFPLECNTIAMYVGCVKKMLNGAVKSREVTPQIEKLANAIICALRYQFAGENRGHKKENLEQLVLLNGRELKKYTEKYNSAFDLLEDNLSYCLSDGCFVALLPYFLFYHFTYAAGYIRKRKRMTCL